MGISMNSTCFACRVNNITQTVGPLGTEQQLTAFLKKWMEKASKYDEFVDSARCGYYTDCLVKELYGIDLADKRKKDKEDSNRFVVERIDHIKARVEAAADPVRAGLQYAILGNYLDFAILANQISYEQLDEMLNEAKDIDIPADTVSEFARDLAKGKRLLIITDNAGEIGFDWVLAQVLKKVYPHLEITFCVRGYPVNNDATREDAFAVGITFPIIDSGNAVGGHAMELLSKEAKQAMDDADVILAKGMGNTESLYGCGYNVYYAFLVKCQRFVEVFNVPLMAPTFIKDKQ